MEKNKISCRLCFYNYLNRTSEKPIKNKLYFVDYESVETVFSILIIYSYIKYFSNCKNIS